jgi:Ca-activated chloride channel family protein
MEWQHPGWLYGILPLGVAWLLLSLDSERRRRRAAEAFVARAMWSRILPPDSRARFWVKLLLREVALITGLVALAGPRFGTQYEEVVPRGSDLYVLIDVSRSMLAQDVPPSRLGRAKADVAALVNRLEGERIGLIAFAGQAVVKCPLTVDYDAFRRSLDELDPGSAPRGGTAIGDAIRKALEVFQARTGRDQAILLITDGDDQQSYPLEAAAVAAERHVTIFTVGLGDADQGARIPRGAESKSYVEYQGHQVWSKLDGALLKEIALKTSGVYVPVGTRAYDLGELYAHYLQGRRGGDAEGRKRIRRADQFQIFLALALLALLADLLTRPYPVAARPPEPGIELRAGARGGSRVRGGHPALPVATALVFCAAIAGAGRVDNPNEAVHEGLRWYRNNEFAKARDSFASAREQFDRRDAARAAIAAFDEACALHRKGDVAQARESYLKAGLAHDKELAAAAHFNLGTLASEEVRRLAGDHPENVAPEKRQEILDRLKGAVASFRHSLELQPDNARARRDIELVRQWIKYYTDKWQARDREARRQGTNLVAFLEFLIETERALRESVKALTATAPADAFAELKRLQGELQEEIAPLKEKIRAELQPQQPGGGSAPQAQSQEVERGITLLLGWADAAGDRMSSAVRQLDDRQAGPAAGDQQSAIDELEKIWEAVIPFRPLLARDLADQTLITRSLQPGPSPDAKPENGEPSGKNETDRDKAAPAPQEKSADVGHPSLGTEGEDLARLAEMQERTLRRTRLLKPKAEAELARLEVPQAPDAGQKGHDPKSGTNDPPDAAAAKSKPVDPEQIKAGYRKAIELAPQAVGHMERAGRALKQKDRQAAYPPAEEARKTLEAIQKAQPRNDPQDQKQQDQEKNKEDQQKQDQQKKDQQQDDREKEDQQKKDQQKKDQEQKKQEERNQSDESKQDQKKPQPQVSPDRIEEALRKVRERQQEKRERDRRMKARILERVPVEKDW